ncbi:hypothetical protein DYB30_004537 [Aphanomyces astaci]|uniref:DDE-1 domain-containing protein n=1 Tax=Aphanomyces astaci TaxID=112090 RepID=A0A397D4X9_APHAT|nr:hypothetical protein DYB30_004537 [Aphanomyces astaci]
MTLFKSVSKSSTHFQMSATKGKQTRYTNGQRKQLLARFRASNGTSERQFCRDNKISRGTRQDWRSRESAIMASKRHSRHATLGGQGRRQLLPFKDDLLAYMRAKRDSEEHLRVFHLMRWVNTNHKEWLVQYPASKKNEAVAYQSFRSLMHRFADRNRFRHHMGNAFHFWSTYGHYPRSQILNVDETGVYFDMPPGMMLAEIGKSSKYKKTTKHSERLTAVMTIRADGVKLPILFIVKGKTTKHSERLTAVMTIRADGVKLPILFIVKGKPGDTIDTSELPTYPPGHVYAVQESARMDDRVWDIYLDELLTAHVEDSSVLLVDNLACHVSDKSYYKVAETMFSVLEPLPPNSTSRCQPLDVGVMGPLKAMLKTAWLLEDDERNGDILTAQEKRLATVKRTIKVWDRISTDTIVKAFDKAIPSVLEI